MQLRVLFFGVLRDHFGSDEMLEYFPGSTVADLLRYYRVLSPELGPLWEKIAVAVNQQYAQSAQALQNGDEVALLPPVSGGSVQSNYGFNQSRSGLASCRALL